MEILKQSAKQSLKNRMDSQKKRFIKVHLFSKKNYLFNNHFKNTLF